MCVVYKTLFPFTGEYSVQCVHSDTNRFCKYTCCSYLYVYEVSLNTCWSGSDLILAYCRATVGHHVVRFFVWVRRDVDHCLAYSTSLG
jgi:hypothetical protein